MDYFGFKDDFYFKNLTINKTVVMGYNTFISLPGKGDLNPLKNRLNIVITNNHYDILSSKYQRKMKYYFIRHMMISIKILQKMVFPKSLLNIKMMKYLL